MHGNHSGFSQVSGTQAVAALNYFSIDPVFGTVGATSRHHKKKMEIIFCRTEFYFACFIGDYDDI